MNSPLPPIYRDIRRLLVHTEGTVMRFSRYHKYSVGSDLRQNAMALMRGVHRACFEPAKQAEHVQTLVWLLDDYKLTLQLAMEVGAFKHGENGKASFAAFETAVSLSATIGKQCGGWQQKTANRQLQKVSQTQSTAKFSAMAPGSKPECSTQANPASLSACAASNVAFAHEARP